MKLIIDIPEEVYKKIVADKYAIYDKMFYSIKNGTPLEDIKAEIEALEDKMLNVPNDWRTSEVFENVLVIIDKYKAESEEKV